MAALVLGARPAIGVVYHPGVDHGHTPCGRWADIQADPQSGPAETALCKVMTPMELVAAAVVAEFGDKPIARAHLEWYLKGGGVTLNENVYLRLMLMKDRKVQAAMSKEILSILSSGKISSGKISGFLKIEQSADYENQDFRFAFGAIDRLDFEVDFNAGGMVHAWFQDRYEWHPYYPKLYTAFPDDGARETNCVHAAFVELKATGAADFWMQGEATVPLRMITLGASPAGGGDDGSKRTELDSAR